MPGRFSSGWRNPPAHPAGGPAAWCRTSCKKWGSGRFSHRAQIGQDSWICWGLFFWVQEGSFGLLWQKFRRTEMLIRGSLHWSSLQEHSHGKGISEPSYIYPFTLVYTCITYIHVYAYGLLIYIITYIPFVFAKHYITRGKQVKWRWKSTKKVCKMSD